jgi:hypothetical protein
MSSKFRSIALVLIAPMIALTVGMSLALTSASADPTLTAVFTGTATTGYGQPFPIEVDSTDVVVRDDGAVGLAYTYGAAGQVAGEVAGHFTYTEEGRIYFMDPSDPTTLAGSELFMAEFSVLPSNPNEDIFKITDTCGTECYENGRKQGTLSSLPTWARDFAIKSLLHPDASAPSTDPSLTYGYFTFTNEYGTFTGYATPSFTGFSIQVDFDKDEQADA